MKNTKDNNYAFVMHNEAHSKSMYKWIMVLGASKHMSLYRTTFSTYEVIAPRIVDLDDNSVAKAIRIGSIVIDLIAKCNINRICIKDALHVPEF